MLYRSLFRYPIVTLKYHRYRCIRLISNVIHANMIHHLSYTAYAPADENMQKTMRIEPQSLTVSAKHDKIIDSFLTT